MRKMMLAATMMLAACGTSDPADTNGSNDDGSGSDGSGSDGSASYEDTLNASSGSVMAWCGARPVSAMYKITPNA